MIRNAILLLCVFTATSCAGPTSAQSTKPEAPADSSVDQILDALDARGKDLKSFTADLTLGEADAATGDETTRRGKFWYQADHNGSARIRVTFDTKVAGNKVTEDKIEYLLSGPDLIDRTYRTRTQVTRHILKPGEKLDLFKLGEGPFPLPIGQKKEDVHAQFDVKNVGPKKDDPVDTTHVQLIPKAETRLERKFKSIDVWVGTKDQMPHRIETLDKNESSTRITELSKIEINAPLADKDFALPEIDKQNWQLQEEAFNE